MIGLALMICRKIVPEAQGIWRPYSHRVYWESLPDREKTSPPNCMCEFCLEYNETIWAIPSRMNGCAYCHTREECQADRYVEGGICVWAERHLPKRQSLGQGARIGDTDYG